MPIVLVYARVLRRHRNWGEPAYYLPSFTDLLSVQPGEALWYDWLRMAGIAGAPGREDAAAELMLGFTPILAVSALAGLLLLGRISRIAGPHPWDGAARAFLAVAFLGWLLTVSYGHRQPWHLVFDVVPGARGIRTPFRIQLASLFFLCLGLSHAAARGLVFAGQRQLPGLAAGVGAALALCVAEQIGAPPPNRDTAAMMRWISVSHRPDFRCDAFYALPAPAGSGLPWSEQQSDAMLLSQWIGMPTINGNSSWYPTGWSLQFPDRPEYASQALSWIDAHGLRDRVCGVDPRAGRWEPGIQPLLRAANRRVPRPHRTACWPTRSLTAAATSRASPTASTRPSPPGRRTSPSQPTIRPPAPSTMGTSAAQSHTLRSASATTSSIPSATRP